MRHFLVVGMLLGTSLSPAASQSEGSAVQSGTTANDEDWLASMPGTNEDEVQAGRQLSDKEPRQPKERMGSHRKRNRRKSWLNAFIGNDKGPGGPSKPYAPISLAPTCILISDARDCNLVLRTPQDEVA